MPEIVIEPKFTEGVFKRWCHHKTGLGGFYKMDYVLGYEISNIENTGIDFTTFYVYQTDENLWSVCDAETGSALGNKTLHMPTKEEATEVAIISMLKKGSTANDYLIAKRAVEIIIEMEGISTNEQPPTIQQMKENLANPNNRHQEQNSVPNQN